MSTERYLKRYEGIDGGDFVIWMAWSKQIAKYIRKWELAPVALENLPVFYFNDPTPQPIMADETESNERLRIKPRPFPGGLKIAHFHHKGQIYLLNDEQWREFTTKTIGMVRDKIRKAEMVGYQPLMALTESALAIS